MKHDTETKTNAYWLGLLAHLQSSSVPRKVNFVYEGYKRIFYRKLEKEMDRVSILALDARAL